MLVDRALLIVAMTLSGRLVSAQVCPTPPTVSASIVQNDIHVDDTAPFGVSNGPHFYYHASALRVAAENMDGDGTTDIIVGGNSGPAVAVRWFASGGIWSEPCGPEFLEDNITTVGANEGKGASACYDFEIADLNGDSLLDIAVGRHLDLFAPGGELLNSRNTVFFNDQAGCVDPNPCAGCVHFPADAAVKIQPPFFYTSTNKMLTTSLACGDIDLDGDVDLMSCGNNFSPQYYENDGLDPPTFAYQASFLDGATESDEQCHYVLLEDLDTDGDLDLFVSHKNSDPTEPVVANRVWFNDAHTQPAPFVKSTQPDLAWAGLATISWVPANDPPPPGCTAGVAFEAPSTYEPVFADLDLDGDLDLVASSYAGNHAAYLNNGAGEFGSSNTAPGDGCPAFEFPPVTASWQGTSQCAWEVARGLHLAEGLPDPFASCPDWTEYVFTVPGAILNACRGVTAADLNGDEFPEVAFSNAAEMEEFCALSVPGAPLPYLSPSGPPVPLVYDYVFLNATTQAGQLEFEPCVETVGIGNDGTAYGEFVRIDNDRRPDWLDANFANSVMPGCDPTDLCGFWYGNKLYWGNTLSQAPCSQGGQQAAAGGDPSVSLYFTADLDWAGEPFQILASGTPQGPTLTYGGAEIPIASDALTDLFLGKGGVVYPGSLGVLDDEARGWAEITIPADLAPAGVVWVVAVALKGEAVVQVSNVVVVEFGGS